MEVRRIDELRRFRMLMAGVYCGICVSSVYGFSVFTEFLRNEYGFNQKDITNISTVGNCFLYFTLPAGFLFDYAGPLAVYPIAGTLGFLGFLLFGLTFSGYIAPSVAKFCVFNALLYLGCSSFDGVTVMTMMLNFPTDTGAMVIIQKTFSGLGTSVLMAYYRGWFSGNFSGYAYFAGTQVAVCALVGIAFIRYPPYYLSIRDQRRVPAERQAALKATQQLYLKQRPPVRRLIIGYVLVGCCLVFLTVQSIVMAYAKPANPRPIYTGLAVIALALVALFSLMAMPFQCLGRYVPVRPSGIAGVGIAKEPCVPLEDWHQDPVADEQSLHRSVVGVANHEPLSSERSGNTAPEDGTHSKAAPGEKGVAVVESGVPLGTQPAQQVAEVPPQYTTAFFRNLLSIELWCMWLTCFGTWGTMVVVQSNSAQIYRSVSHGEFVDTTNTLYITMISVGSAIGRSSMGCYDLLMSSRERRGKSTLLTTNLLPFPPFLCAMAFLFFASLPAHALILPFILGAIGNGAGWGVCVLAIRKMYAAELGKHYAFCFTSGIVATIALNRLMFGELYDREAQRLGTYPVCHDPSCVRTSMWVLMAINAAAVVAATVVHLRFRGFSNRELRLRKERAAELDAVAAQCDEQREIATHISDEAADVEAPPTRPME